MYVAAAVIANLVKQRRADEAARRRLAEVCKQEPAVLDVGAILANERRAVVKLYAERCRLEAFEVPRPALARLGRDFIVVGCEEGILFGHTDGVIYEVQFSVDTGNEIDWQRVEPKHLQWAAIDRFALVVSAEPKFRTW